MNANRQVAIIGARGFVGAELLGRLAKAGESPMAIGSREVDLLAPGAANKLEMRFETASTVVFCSAVTPDKARGADVTEANLRMCQAFIEAARATRPAHIVYLSSDAVYPYGKDTVDEETRLAPESPYGAMHMRREELMADALGECLLVVRLTQVYGADDTHNAYGPCRMARQALQEGKIVLFGDGEERRDHIDVRDVAALLQRLIDQRETGVVNLATGHSHRFAEIADIVLTHAGGSRIERRPRTVEIKHRDFDNSRLRRLVPNAATCSPKEGIEHMMQYLRTRDLAVPR